MTKLDELLCPNNRILGLMKRIQQALSPRGVTSTTSDDLGKVIRSVDSDDILERWDQVLLQLKRTHLHLFLVTGFDGIETDPALIIIKKHKVLSVAAVEDEDLADLLHVREEQAAGTNAHNDGNFVSGAYRTRVLNTVLTNEISGASVASNQITLPAGTYFIEASCPGVRVNNHKIKLRDTTGAADVLSGTSEFSDSTDGSATVSFLTGRFTLSGTVALEIQHRCTTTRNTNGFGNDVNYGDIEVYSDVRIKKIS